MAEDGTTTQDWVVTVTKAVVLNDETEMLAFGFGTPPQTGAATIDAVAKTILIEVETGTDVTNLVSTFTLSEGATAKVGSTMQTSGTSVNDFTNPVTYKVMAEDGTTTQDWVVTVTKAVALNDETNILTFGFGTPTQSVDAIITLNSLTIEIVVVAGTDVTNLAPMFTLSNGATAKVGVVVQESGSTTNDFSNPVTYIVTAEDGTTIQEWTVTVTIATRINAISLRQMKIYPNPFYDRTIIEFDNFENSEYNLTIFNMAGTKVLEIMDVTSDKIEVKRGNLSAGVYIAELKGAINYARQRIIVK
jgi:hypothetical protein